MEIIIVIVGVIVLLIDSSKSEKEARKPIAYDIQTGRPIYDKKYFIKEYDQETGRPIYQNEHKIISYDAETGEPIYDKKAKIIGYEIDTGYPIFEGEEHKLNQPVPAVNQNNTPNRSRLSNTILMIVGAVLVVVASIIFLVSSWDSIHGFIKTLILIAIQMIFILFSKICQRQLDIPKVSKVFDYIVIAFVPIIMLSLSCFEALGEYLSLSGEGWPLYFGAVFLLTDFFYKLYAKTKNDIVLKRMSFIAEILSIIFFTNHLFESFDYALLIFIIHSLIMYILLQGNYLDKKAYNIFNNIYTYILIAITAISVIVSDSMLYNLWMLLYTILYFMKYIKYGEPKEKMLDMILFLFCYASTLRIIDLIEVSSYFIYLLAFIPIALLTQTMKSETLKSATRKIILFASLGVILISLFDANDTIFYLLTFVAAFALYFIMYYLFKKPVYKALSYAMFSAIFIDICYMTGFEDIAKYVLLLMVVLIYSFESIFDELKDDSTFITIVAMLYLESILLAGTYYVIIPFILQLIYLKLEKKNENFLILPMIFNLSLFDLETDVTATVISFLLLVTYSVISFMKRKVNVYSIFSLITLFFIAVSYDIAEIIFWIILLIWAITHTLVNAQEKNRFYKVISVISSLGLYITVLSEYLDVTFVSFYILGFYIALIVLSKYVFAKVNSIEILEIIGAIFIALAPIFLITEALDGVAMIVISLILCIASFSKKWQSYFYCTLVSMIVYIFILAIRFWGTIPWYVYILFIGVALIIFAMYDEKRKMKKEKIEQEKIEQEKNEK